MGMSTQVKGTGNASGITLKYFLFYCQVMKYSANFVKTKNGNASKEGSVLTVRVEGAHFLNGAVYQNGAPIIVFQTEAGDSDVDILLKLKNRSIKGKAKLKVRAFDSQWRGFGWDDEFDII